MSVEIGAEAPDFVLRDQNNQEVRLSDFRGKRTVLLIFHPLAFTGICKSELGEVRDNLDQYVNDKVQAIAVSVDSVYSHKMWADQEGFQFPLLADFWPHGAVARTYGVFNDSAGVADRGTFVIDKTGVVRFAERNAIGQARDPGRWRETLATTAD